MLNKSKSDLVQLKIKKKYISFRKNCTQDLLLTKHTHSSSPSMNLKYLWAKMKPEQQTKKKVKAQSIGEISRSK